MNITLRALAFTLLAAAFASGCGGCGENNGEDVCVDVTCEAGVCDPGTGECVNADDCDGDDANCLDGFTCQDDGTCSAEVACTTNSNCAQGEWCDDGTCVDDPCNDVTCDRGVCQVGVGMCVNAETCTGATQGEACLEGNICVEGECTSEEDFCADLACERGVCSTDERVCVNAENCAGDDTQCVEGDFCGADNTCQTNECADDGTCPGGGICEPATGVCVNATTCTGSSQCIDAFVCLSGACIAQEQACGVDGCGGNQECAYDASALAAACVENTAEGCVNALDCLGDRVCDAGVCADAPACLPDEYEDNNDVANATNVQTDGEFGIVDGLSLCGSDVDVFTFDTDADPNGIGELTVRVDIAPQDVGLGTLELELVDPDGASVATATNVDNGVPTTFIEISSTVDVGDGGVFTINVTDTGDVSTAGVRYRLNVDLVAADVAATCGAATELSLTTPNVVAIPESAGTSLNSTCGDANGSLYDAAFTFTLAEDSYVQIQLTPEVGLDVIGSVRTNCTADDSETSGSCVDQYGGGQSESIQQLLSAGTYVLFLEPYNTNAAGNVVVSFDVEPTICTSAANSCVDATTASICNPTGTAFDQVSCPDGCDTATGACLRPAGDTCATAIAVPATGIVHTVNLNDMAADYDPGAASCVPDRSFFSRTDGEDAVYVATVPADKVITMEAVSPANDDIAIYLSTDCADVGNSCLVGDDAFSYTTVNSEFVYYKNETGADQTIYAFVDVGTIESSVGQSRVTIEITDPVCTPGARVCVLNRESQLCNASGTGYDSTSLCEDGCDVTTGECTVTNDVCTGATVLTSGVTTSGTLLGYTDDYEPGESDCGSISEFDSGNGAVDAVFAVVTTADNQAVSVLVDPAGFDPIVWLSDSCVAGGLGSCITGADASDSDNVDETLEFFAPTAGTYYVTVQDGDTGGSVGTFNITATVTTACTPGAILGCDAGNANVEYCTDVGTIASLPCSIAGCDAATGRCVEPGGDTCADVIPLNPAGGTLAGNFDNDGTDSLDFPSGVSDQCNFPSSLDTGGDEFFYSINLSAGDLLEVNYVEGGTSSYGNVFFQTDCGSLNSCSGFAGDGTNDLLYFAEQAETVFVVVDAWTSFSSFTYDLTWSISQPGWVCQPNSSSCSGPNTVETCAADGLSFTTEFCPTSCGNGSCVDDPTVTDTCATAPNVGTNLSLRVDIEDDHTATLDPNGATCPIDASGPDAFFAVNAQVYDVITVKAKSTSVSDDLAVYIISDCNDAAGSCLAGVDNDDDLLLQKQVLQAGTYIVGIDHDSGIIFGTDVGVEISVEPGCIPGTPPACNLAGTAIEFCEEGITNEYVCSGGCTNGMCNTPRGDACFDAIPLDTTATQVAGNWANNVNTIDLDDNLVGNCLFASGPDGADDIYSVSLAAGDTLTASLTSNETTALLYLVEDCQNPAGTCAGNDITGDFEAPFSYHAATAQTVFLVVDRTDTSTDNTYTLHYDVDSTLACAPGVSQCSDATTRVDCNADGTVATPVTCTNGCVAGGCIPGTEADSCATAVDIGAGGTFTADYNNLTDQMNYGGNCAGETEDGPEMFFSATLSQNDILRVNAQAIDSFEPPLVYFVNDCTGDAAACLGGAHEDSPGQLVDDAVTIEYQAPADETIIIVVDTENSFANEPVRVSFEILVPDCDPAIYQQQCNVAADAFLYCNERGFIREYACAGVGTCEAATGRCTEPVGDVCLDPFDANPAGTAMPRTVTGTFTGFANNYDLGTGNQCTGSQTPGNEPVYAVDLTAGQMLTASVVSTETTPVDIAIYATADCSDIRDQCLAGSDVQGATSTPEQLTYTATTDETIYLMVDSFFSNAAGAFDLTVTVN